MAILMQKIALFRTAFLNPKYSATRFFEEKKSPRPTTEDFHHLLAFLKASFNKRAPQWSFCSKTTTRLKFATTRLLRNADLEALNTPNTLVNTEFLVRMEF